LKAFYKFLLKIKEISENPLSKHQSLKTPKKVQIPFSEKELINVLKISFNDVFEGVRDKLIIELFYSTGMRRAELVNLKLHSVDFEVDKYKLLLDSNYSRRKHKVRWYNLNQHRVELSYKTN